MLFWICVVIVLVSIVALAVLICLKVISEKHIRFLEQNSIALKKLKELNSQYDFYEDFANLDEFYTYDNERYFDNISCRDFLIYQLQSTKFEAEKEIKKAVYNRKKYQSYCDKVKGISHFGEYEKPIENLNKKHLLSTEMKLFERYKLKAQCSFDIRVVLYCAKMNGYIYRGKSADFSGDEIVDLIKRLNDKNGRFFNDKEIWDAICRVERGKVSNKMRFAVYERDGYKCRHCGKSDLTENLEIDHIKPISKGGKSTYDNLQTLCRSCNKNKGDRY